MSLERDLESAKEKMISIAVSVARESISHSNLSIRLMDKVEQITACVELPGDWPLRVFCLPNCFNLQC